MNILKRLALTLFVSTISSPWIVGAAFAADPAFTVDTRVTSATVTSKNASGVTARVSTSFDVPSRYRNQFPRNSNRYVHVPSLRVIEGAKQAARGSALSVGLLAAVAGAGWVIDELTGQIGRIEMQPDPDHETGTWYLVQWSGSSRAYPDRSSAASHRMSGQCAVRGTEQVGPDLWRVNVTLTNANGQCASNSSFTYSRRYCSQQGHAYCNTPTDPPLIPVTVPVSQQQLQTELWPYLQTLPNHVLAEAFAPNPLNTPEIAADLAQQYAEIAANNPNLSYDPATNTFTYTDPDTGEQVSTNPNADPDLNPLDLPDDYARENTLAESVTLLSALKDLFVDSVDMPDELIPEDYEYKGITFDTMGTDMTLVPDPPSLNFMPNLPQYSSSCQQLTLNWKGHSVQFPDENQCSKLGNAKTIIGYMLYVLTAFGIAHVVLTPRGAS